MMPDATPGARNYLEDVIDNLEQQIYPYEDVIANPEEASKSPDFFGLFYRPAEEIISNHEDKKRLPPEPDPLNANDPTTPTEVDAKLQNRIDSLRDYYVKNNKSKATYGLLTNLTNAFGLQSKGSSRYRTFRTADGDVFTLRVSNHRGRVSNFDKRGETEGISIVIESRPKGALINDGEAHVVEYKYKKKDLDNSKGNPIAQIIESLSNALKTGIYEDKTGLAKIDEANSNDFFSNREEKVSTPGSLNTPNGARTDEAEALDTAKIQNNSGATNPYTTENDINTTQTTVGRF
jgi:hypothetical protein